MGIHCSPRPIPRDLGAEMGARSCPAAPPGPVPLPARHLQPETPAGTLLGSTAAESSAPWHPSQQQRYRKAPTVTLHPPDPPAAWPAPFARQDQPRLRAISRYSSAPPNPSHCVFSPVRDHMSFAGVSQTRGDTGPGHPYLAHPAADDVSSWAIRQSFINICQGCASPGRCSPGMADGSTAHRSPAVLPVSSWRGTESVCPGWRG